MASFDDLDLRAAASIGSVSAEQLQDVRRAIADDLLKRHDAWPAVQWLAATGDDGAKRRLIGDLEQVIAGVSNALLTSEAAADAVASGVVFGRSMKDRRQIGRAFEFSSALHASLPDGPADRSDAAFERQVRERRRRAEAHEQRVESLTRLGVEHGKGLPFWELYMRRRSKKSWGS